MDAMHRVRTIAIDKTDSNTFKELACFEHFWPSNGLALDEILNKTAG